MYTENKSVETKELGGGVTRKILSYSEKLMTVELRFPKGGVGAKHSHPHEQIGYIVSGSLVYQEEGCADKELHTGDTYYVKPNAVHGIVVLEDTVLLDIFTPVRKDFLELQEDI
ncbi:MAG: cupin domain-containing protein [Lachnospiraceae bacterium]|nr:cupin domain-containing protein [Lachnospiraceae bacterium]